MQSAAPTRPADYPKPDTDTRGIPRATTETVLVSPFNETEAAIQLMEAHAGELAALIVEPLQRALRPEPGFLEALKEAALAVTGEAIHI